MTRFLSPFLIGTLLTTLHSTSLRAEVQLPDLLSHNMVLQRDKPVLIWGKADPGEQVSVEFAGQSKKTTTTQAGRWRVTLDAMPANSKPGAFIVKGKNTITLNDVLIGEVWVCSGQSNMQWTVNQSMNAAAEAATANLPLVRQFAVLRVTAKTPQEDCKGTWQTTNPLTVRGYTAVGFYFARELHKQLDIPIGIINSSWGGTRSEAWTSEAALDAEPAAAVIQTTWKKAIAEFDPAAAKAANDAALEKWKTRAAKAKLEGKKVPRRPRAKGDPATSRHAPARLYNAMISPLKNFGIRGAIWYQGESNQSRAHQYRYIFPAMITDWRKQFAQGDFPFYFAQLANFKAASKEPNTPDMWAELQEAQTLTLRELKNVGMATINDIGEARDIHPKNKQDVGKRLALWALARDYGKKDLVHSGPIYRSMKVEGNKIRVHFDHVGGGLKIRKTSKNIKETEASKEGKEKIEVNELQRFEIAGADKKFVWAKAKIDGDTVVVYADGIEKPVAVRYAWASNPEGANLINAEGLPAPLFRSDDWPGITEKTTAPPIGF